MSKTLHTKPLSRALSVSKQLLPDQAFQVAELGFKLVICNRPDGESEGQPTSAEIEASLNSVGVGYKRIFMAPDTLPESVLNEFTESLEAADGVVLAFCQTGTRSAGLWAATKKEEDSRNVAIDKLQNAGFLLENVQPLLNQNPVTNGARTA